MLSNDWQYLLGEEFCSKVTDGTHDSPKQAEYGKPLITSKHIKGDEIDFDTAYLISEKDFNEINKRSQVEQWDVIISMIGAYCGFCFIERNEEIDYAVKNVGLFKTGSEVNAKWLYYYLNSSIGKSHLDKVKGGSTQPYIALGSLRKLPILVPKNHQLKEDIVRVLDAIDSKIRVNNRINTELEAMAKTLYDYWFVQFDFPDVNGKPYKASGGKMAYNPVLKREIPQGWSVCELGEHITFERGISYRSKDITETGTPLVNLNSFALTGKFKPNGTKYFSGSYKPEKLCNIGDLVIAITDVTRNADIIGKSFIVPDAFEGKRALISCDVALVKSSYFGNAYLETLFNSNHYHNYIKQFASGTLVLHLDLKGVNWYRTELPPRELLSRFEDFCTPLFQQRGVVLQENKKLEELRDWLLPMLMNGQVTVKPSTEPQEAQHG